MRLTDCKRYWVIKQLTKYAQQIGIREKEIPAVVLTRREVLAMPKELTQGRRTVTNKYLGICFRRAKTIFISIKNHKSAQQIIDTIVHELVHYRFQYLKHGKDFKHRIDLILKKCKRYPLKELYPPDSNISPELTTAAIQQVSEMQWTTQRLIDELFLCLMRAKGEADSTKRKYEEQAKYLIYRIRLHRPPPYFIVNIKDLSHKIKEELASLEEKSLNNVMNEAIGRIFEQIDERYYLLSVKRLLKWKLE
jgi:hypothetical protein